MHTSSVSACFLVIVACGACGPSRESSSAASADCTLVHACHGRQDCPEHCSTDRDCARHTPDGSCERADVSDGTDAISCKERLAALESRLARVVAAADRACERDQDCLQVVLATPCYHDFRSDCAEAGYVSQAGLDTISAELSAVTDDTCPALLDSGCADPVPANAVVFCPQFRRSRSCQDGRCK